MFRFAIAIAAAAAPTCVFAQSSDEVALMRAVYDDLNPISIRENVEYCGYLGFTADGDLAVSPPTRGDESSCLSDDPTNIEVVIASYHTHAAHSSDYSSELPSGTDMEGDEAEGIDGWVATPGGRIWYIDTTDMITRQICGIGCVVADPDFVEGESGFIESSYGYDDLVTKLDE